jgi:hypothetical protein
MALPPADRGFTKNSVGLGLNVEPGSTIGPTHLKVTGRQILFAGIVSFILMVTWSTKVDDRMNLISSTASSGKLFAYPIASLGEY